MIGIPFFFWLQIKVKTSIINAGMTAKNTEYRMAEKAYQKCINPDCGAEFGCNESFFKCPQCGDLLDVQYNWTR